jgi:hypothetical protein
MKSTMAALAFCGTLAAGPAWAQLPFRGPAQGPLPSAGGTLTAPPAPIDNKVFPATSALPGPVPVEEIKPPELPLPDEPIEPYLLTKEHGPFMVLAKTFRGPDAVKMAVVLCKELRQDFGLPAYVLRSKDFPQHSYIRGTPPTAPSETMTSAIKWPEKVRTFDEAAVLVGNEKTLKGSELLLHKVKKLHPKCLDRMHSPFKWREGGGLSRALRTTNPYVPVQYLYPRTNDRLVVQMNSGLRSLVHCSGHYSLQVAQFTGRSGFDLSAPGGPPPVIAPLRESPLQTAHDDAERMAEKLARAPEVQRLGVPIFVHHDRTSSRVFVGSFESENDPAAVAVRNELLRLAVPLTEPKRGRAALERMIVPATSLTKVDSIKASLL